MISAFMSQARNSSIKASPQPIHNKNGSIQEGIPGNELFGEIHHYTASSKNRTDVNSDATSSVEKYLTDREMLAENPLFIFLNKTYQDLILQYITSLKDIRALRSTCKTLRDNISLSILNFDLNFTNLPELIEKAKNFKFIQLSVSNPEAMQTISPDILNKIASLKIHLIQLYSDLLFEAHQWREFFLFTINYRGENGLELTIDNDKQLESLTVGEFRSDKRKEKSSVIVKVKDHQDGHFRTFTLGELNHNVSLKYQPASSKKSYEVVIDKMCEGSEVNLDEIQPTNITVGEMEKNASIHISEHLVSECSLRMHIFTLGVIHSGAKISDKLHTIRLKEITYSASNIHDKKFLIELQKTKKCTENFLWRMVYTYLTLENLWNVIRPMLFAAGILLIVALLFFIGPPGWAMLSAYTGYRLREALDNSLQ